MSQISEDAARNFVNAWTFSRDNTVVGLQTDTYKNIVNMHLHGYRIACWDIRYKQFSTTLAGHPTKTTISRLNAVIKAMYDHGHIDGMRTYYIKKGVPYIGYGLPVSKSEWFLHDQDWINRHYGMSVVEELPPVVSVHDLSVQELLQML